MFSTIIRSQENDIVSDTKAVIETQVETKHYYKYYERIIENTTIIVHYTTETTSKLTVTKINCLKTGFQYIYRSFYLTV